MSVRMCAPGSRFSPSASTSRYTCEDLFAEGRQRSIEQGFQCGFAREAVAGGEQLRDARRETASRRQPRGS